MRFFIIRISVIILTFDHVYAANSVSMAKEECRKRIAECTMSGGANTPVCGSDSVTYPSQCQVVSRQCQGVAILIKHTGPCPETPPCFSARLTARPGSRPVCRPDGTYSPVQCHTETGYCWCVTAQGRPLPDTSIKHQRPRCGLKLSSKHHQGIKTSNTPFIRSGQRMRSSLSTWKHRRQYSGSVNNDNNDGNGNRHRRNNCDRNEKIKFNQNLIDNFKIEYRRANTSVDSQHGDTDNEDVKRVLLWKFMTLDKNANGYLDQMEYKELKKIAKKAIKPKKCARTFTRNCDLDRDSKFSRQEWTTCLANDFALLKTNIDPVHSRPTFSDDPPDTQEEGNANDCISDRRSVMEDERQNSQNSQEKFYIPQCTPDGRYHKVQCYSGYCWCVYQDTGKPIPGTSSKERNPNCNPTPTPSRPIKGCPESRKQVFLRDLMDLMQQEMKSSNTDSDELNVKWQAPKEERIATWHFVMLDKDKNKVLERKEWKTFRAMVENNKQLRKCGRKLPRYCDINNDRRISMTEWLSCLNAQHSTTGENVEKSPTTKSRRMGPNPLDQFLNDD